AEVDLHRWLDLAEYLAGVLDLLDYLGWRAHVGDAAFAQRFGGLRPDGADHLVVAGIVRGVGQPVPGAERLAEHLDVAVHRLLDAFDRRLVRLGDVAVERHLDALGPGRMAGRGPGLAVGAHECRRALQAAGERHDHQVIAVLAGPDEGGLGEHGGDPDGWVRLLHGPRR